MACSDHHHHRFTQTKRPMDMDMDRPVCVSCLPQSLSPSNPCLQCGSAPLTVHRASCAAALSQQDPPFPRSVGGGHVAEGAVRRQTSCVCPLPAARPVCAHDARRATVDAPLAHATAESTSALFETSDAAVSSSSASSGMIMWRMRTTKSAMPYGVLRTTSSEVRTALAVA